MSDDIRFDSMRIPQERISVFHAYVNDAQLIAQGKKFFHEVLAELVRKSVTLHRLDIDNMVTDIIMSPETREYVTAAIRKAIDEQIKEEIAEMFGKKNE